MGTLDVQFWGTYPPKTIHPGTAGGPDTYTTFVHYATGTQPTVDSLNEATVAASPPKRVTKCRRPVPLRTMIAAAGLPSIIPGPMCIRKSPSHQLIGMAPAAPITSFLL
ncbi:hypothetical protein R1flu_022983 [Riccia fluitans]|uniref:Uncharacterized protein n=1 Tax=Riccia fluitans TaxID=41844 RepID=A0ABD1XTR7_9MARC